MSMKKLNNQKEIEEKRMRKSNMNIREKEEKCCRLVVWNIQLALNQEVKIDVLLEELESIQPDILLIQEPGPAGNKGSESIREILLSIADKVKIVHSYNGVDKSKWQYGGVLSVVMDSWVNRIHSTTQDPKIAGRYNVVRMRGKQGRVYSFINIYKPHWNSDGKGVAALQRMLLNIRFPTSKSAQEVWMSDLFEIVDGEMREGREVLIAGDFNMEHDNKDPIFHELKVRGFQNVMEKIYSRIPHTRKQLQNVKEKGAIDHIFITEGFHVRDGCIGPFSDISDHSFLVVDMFAESMFQKRFDECTPELRSVHSRKPDSVRRYRERLEEAIQKDGIYEKLNEINHRVEQKILTEEDKKLFLEYVGRLDEVTLKAGEEATRFKKSRCSRDSGISRKVLVWRQIIGWLMRKRQTRSTIKWKLESIGEKGCLLKDLTLDQAKEKLSAAWRQFYDNKKRLADRKQKRYKIRAIGNHLLDPSKSVEAYEKEIEMIENLKSKHLRVRIARKKLKGAGIYMLEKEVNGRKVQILDKEHIETEAIKECWRKVHAADNTPLRTEPLQSLLFTNGSIENWEKLSLKDIEAIPQEVSDSLDRGTRLFLKKVFEQKSKDAEIRIQPDEYHQGWQRQKENTSSAPGINFSHLMNVQPNSLANLTRSIVSNIRLNTGWNPVGYMKAMDSLLMKKPGIFTVKGMRLITLQHCACNHDHKIIGRLINEQGEKEGKFAKEQAGCRNGMNAREQALNKVLILDIARLKHQSMAVIANDAKGCFDRIVLLAAFLVLRRMGVPFTALKAMIDVIFTMKHTVKTIYGESVQTYGGEGARPNGFMQGNGMAGQGFSAISSLLLDICREEGYGFKSKSAISGTSHTVVGTMFVDDLDAMNTRRDGETEDQFLQRTQEFITLWNQLLSVTGGALEPKKTDWCNFSCKKKAGKWRFQEMKGDLVIHDEDSKTDTKLARLRVNEARRTLGVYMAINGSQQGHMDHLLQVIADFQIKMKGSFLTPNEKLLAMKTTITRSIAYGATATAFSPAQSALITKRFRQAVLNGLGYSNKIPLALVHGPRELNGIEVMDYSICQGAEQVRVLLDHWGTNTMTGNLIHTLTEEYDLLVGTKNGFWAMNDKKLIEILPESWVLNCKRFVMENKIDIQVRPPKWEQWRKNDRFIMEMILDCKGWSFTTEELRDFNEVRMNMRILMLSDLLENDMVTEDTWEARERPKTKSAETYNWPKPGKITSKEKQHWQLVLTKLGVVPRNRVIHTMGKWYSEGRDIAHCRMFDWSIPMVDGTEEVLGKFSDKLRKGEAALITDASDDKKGVVTVAFVEALDFEAEDSTQLKGRVQIPCAKDRASSFRGETGGIVAAVTFVDMIADKFMILEGQCKIMCDNKAAVNRANQALDTRWKFQTKSESFDLLRILQRRLHKSKIKFKFEWIKGHQDTSMGYDELTNEARANCRADEEAKSFAKQCTPLYYGDRLPDEEISVLVDGQRVHGRIYATIWDSKQRASLIEYWKKKERFVDHPNIDWEVVHSVNRKLDTNERRLITKLLSGWCATAQKLNQRKQYDDELCPICKGQVEDRYHVFRCPDDRVQSKLRELRQEMEVLAQRKHFKVGTVQMIEAMIDMYLFNTSSHIQQLTVTQERMVEAQRQLGANSFMEGIIHDAWRDYCNGLPGSIALVRWIYEARIRMWKHRNDIVKGEEQDWKRRQAQTNTIYSLSVECPVGISMDDRKHFENDPEEIKLWSDERREIWIRGAEAIIMKYKKLRRRGILNFFETSTQENQRERYLRRRKAQIQEMKNVIQRLLQWKPRHMGTRDDELLKKGSEILTQSLPVQRLWIRKVQQLKRQYDEKWFERNNLKNWRIIQKQEDSVDMKRDETRSPKLEITRKQQKITEWLTKRAEDDG